MSMANGDQVPYHGRADHVAMTVVSELFIVCGYAIPLGGFNVILSVAFLGTLGPIMWTSSSSPPAWACDHRIHLRPGTPPVAVRPYRYAQLQKDKLERQEASMVATGVICPSTSVFSVPVLLVKKQDASWSFCMDYRALNDHKVNDKFSIPVVDELLDELYGACFFTKMDLCSGYDQSLMSDVMCPFLLRYVLVFFDDLLIYINSWSAHLQHIKVILDTLHDNSLFVKRSKCSFGTPSMAYLGHVISATGIAMVDMDKVEAVLPHGHIGAPPMASAILGLAGYYRKFIRDFSLIAAPLTALLRKDAFH
ncbi:hypothetical protein U9M48_012078 [Paspalum notatum var. saurae]|uniref:Reverse transcriptase domain-containing protein n=1 Tax=Paspalum notatum var. saurae TaxID=547442 RepID=A0AAQ3WHP6_PASNO